MCVCSIHINKTVVDNYSKWSSGMMQMSLGFAEKFAVFDSSLDTFL